MPDNAAPREYTSHGEITVDLPIERVFDFATAPYNWIRLNLGNIDQHGPAGPDDLAPVRRTPAAGEFFVETSITPAGVYWIKHFVTHISERPYRWGYTLVRSENLPFDGYIQAEYELESLNGGTATRWKRWRRTILPAGAELPHGLHSLGDKSDTEIMYQQRMKEAMENGVTDFPPIAPLTREEAELVRAQNAL